MFERKVRAFYAWVASDEHFWAEIHAILESVKYMPGGAQT
jgi:hypothetical protein